MISYEGKNRRTVNRLKTIYFDRPEWTPCTVGLLPATWMKHRQALEELVLSHPRVFPGYRRGSRDFDECPDPIYNPGEHTDCWGCVWRNIERGMAGQVVGHPLADWADLATWRPPDPMADDLWGPRDWQATARQLDAARARGDVAGGACLPHGFFFMLLFYLRGMENFMLDLATDEPRLGELTAVVEGYNVAVIRKYLDLGAEYVSFGDDLGMQRQLAVSPAMWRRSIGPSYERMLGLCRDRGACVYLHTDGHVLEIVPDLIAAGVRVLNPQIGANGLAGLQRVAKGKVALNQDLDRQIFPFATPGRIDDHIGEVFEGLYLPEGGLMLSAECAPDVPLENIDAICRTFERLCRLPDEQ